MKEKPKNILALLLVSLLLPLSLHGQEAMHKLDCRFVFVGRERPPVMINQGEENVETDIQVLPNRLTKPVQCTATDGTIRFLSKEGQTHLASARVGSDWRHAIIVFIPNPGKGGDKLPWRCYPIEDTSSNFPSAGAHVTNFHNEEVRFLIGEQRANLASGRSQGFSQPEQRDTFNMAPVVFQFKNLKGDWVTGKETMVKFTEGIRYLMFAYIDPKTKRPQVKVFQDFAKPAAG
ncbi:MAG: hypothetical protein Q7Q71_11720 [Verrucomicrobiota bacterium JB023]|nr:hypothetical protein [Verrucomicrobiota bacterium JB023]